ncbi:MAG: DUF1902 domain-containing protein [Deltaproteobacteria bacterium]|jgi:hypothetical protein|nr:DUF1902 domain-containing protein [Deltaproteobacteria bacterium]
MVQTLIIDIIWDAEANVWIALSKELPGFGLKSDSFDLLSTKDLDALPEFIQLGQTIAKSSKNMPQNIKFRGTNQLPFAPFAAAA